MPYQPTHEPLIVWILMNFGITVNKNVTVPNFFE